MTYTIKEEKNKTRAVSLEREAISGVYIARLCNSYGTEIYKVEREHRTIDRRNALAAYRRYKKEINND